MTETVTDYTAPGAGARVTLDGPETQLTRAQQTQLDRYDVQAPAEHPIGPVSEIQQLRDWVDGLAAELDRLKIVTRHLVEDRYHARQVGVSHGR